MKKIDHPEHYELIKFDGVSSSTVYCGSFDYLTPAPLKWRVREDYLEMLGYGEVLTLKEVAEQLKGTPIITVFYEEPLSGKILQWGNYGDAWYEIGETSGYA